MSQEPKRRKKKVAKRNDPDRDPRHRSYLLDRHWVMQQMGGKRFNRQKYVKRTSLSEEKRFLEDKEARLWGMDEPFRKATEGLPQGPARTAIENEYYSLMNEALQKEAAKDTEVWDSGDHLLEAQLWNMSIESVQNTRGIRGRYNGNPMATDHQNMYGQLDWEYPWTQPQ